jgi:putative copper resistance protein D
MVFIAAINRLRLAPGLTSLRNGAISARQLQRNSLIEAALGLAIVGIVGALGALPPGAHVHAM